MHFHFFASLALLAVFGNPLVIWVATATVAIHHGVFWYFLPQSVFNYDASFWVVAVHAAFVVVEAVGASFIARNFFDNVIGLEKIIQSRTQELNQRNEDMKLILDNTSQGFLTVGRDGYIHYEKSAVVSKWFGDTPKGERIWDFFSRTKEEFGGLMEFAFDDLADDVMPIEYGLSQLPKSLKHDSKIFSFTYTPITNSNDQLTDILIVISNITAEIAKQKADDQQREIMSIFDVILKDKEGFIEFMEDAERLLNSIISTETSQEDLFRNLHTLKGNAGAFGMSSFFSTLS